MVQLKQRKDDFEDHESDFGGASKADNHDLKNVN